MPLGDGIYCNNLNFGSPEIAMTAGGYYFTSIHAWSIVNSEILRIIHTDAENNAGNNYTIEMAHATPAIVNMAFACELAFKSLISEPERKNIHKLRRLFDLLKPQYQKAIKDRTIEETGITDDTSFYSLLDESSNNFVDWRYFFEPSTRDIRSSYSFVKAMVKEVLYMYGIECL